MKKLLAVLLVGVLTCSFTYVSINSQQEAAHAGEQGEALSAEGSAEGGEVIQQAATDVAPTLGDDPVPSPAVSENTALEPTAPNGEEPVAELPYWQSDAIYQDVLDEYETAVGAGHIATATFKLTETSAAGLAGEIRVNGREVISNGTNAPAYDDGSALHLTPREGYPDAGTSSDRSVLVLKESVEGAEIYEATFFFGSLGYPETPYTAFRTYVVLESEDGAEAEETADTPGEATPEAKPENTPGGGDGNEAPKPAPDEEITLDTIGPQLPMTDPTVTALSNLLAPLSTTNIYVGYQFNTTIHWVGNWNGSADAGWFTVQTYWEGRLLTFRIACLNPHYLGPNNNVYAYLGRTMYNTVTAIDPANSIFYFSSWVAAPYSGYQNLGVINATAAWTFVGDLSLTKSSASPACTDGHPLYDLTGAQYGLYSSWSNANTDTNRLHTFTTDSKGATNIKTGLAMGTYYLKEVKAPARGYAIDPTIYTISHNSTHTAFSVKDVPLDDPTRVIIQKLDTMTGEPYGKDDPNGYLLADGEFTVRYWDGYYDTIEEAELAGEPTRTWIIKTANNGQGALLESMLAAGSDPLYRNSQGDAVIPLGTLAIQETSPPPGYLLPSPNPVSVQQIKETGDPLTPVTRLNTVIVQEDPHVVEVEKLDKDTDVPIPDTEFTLYKESAPGAEDWTAVTTLVTDEFGKCVFAPVAVGSYKLDETKPNPLYADIEESGDTAHYFTIEPTSTREAQIFRNELIMVSIDVYKKTIALTNTGLDGRGDQAGNHVGEEEYLYRFGARNNSNVRVDEFVITDSLEYVTSKGYRLTTLWTGTAPEGMDYDGLMHILYKTNLTDPSEPVSFAYNPMQANPANPNNPESRMSVSIEPGWRVWQECVSTTTAIRLEVADLELEEGEYIIGIKAVYGGVVKGFYTGTGWENSDTPQSYDGDRDAISTLADSLDTYTEFELRDWAYAVVATDALLPLSEMGDETIMEGSIRADLFRNWGADSPVLTDIAKDKVVTRVIKTFSYPDEYLGITPGGFFGSNMPFTGEGLALIILALICTTAGVILVTLSLRKKRKRTRTTEEK